MRILIIDGQSGRVGACLTEELKKRGVTDNHTLVCVGTNALATAAMLKAGATAAATGENAAVVQAKQADIITKLPSLRVRTLFQPSCLIEHTEILFLHAG